MALGPFNPAAWLNLIRRIDRVVATEEKLSAVITAQADEIDKLKERVTRLEAREEILIAEAKGASAAAASSVAAQHSMDLARRIGTLEERSRNQNQARLSPPEN